MVGRAKLFQVAAETYGDAEDMICEIRDLFKSKTKIHFYGTYTMAEDPMVFMKERVRMLANEIWKVTSYRFL